MITENVEVSERIGQLNQLYDLIVQLRMPLFSELTVAEIEITPIQKPPHGLNRILSCDMHLFCIIASLLVFPGAAGALLFNLSPAT